MSLRVLAVLSLLIVPLSGCIVGAGTSSAMDGLKDATKAAEALLGDDVAVTLVGVTSIEPFSRWYESDEDGEYEFEAHIYVDNVQGDGKLPGWAYVYCSEGTMVGVLWATGLGVIGDVRETRSCTEDPSANDLDAWAVDSDKAAKTLNDHPDWPEPTEASLTAWELYRSPEINDGSPVWQVVTILDNDVLFGDEIYARIDAVTGEVLEVSDDYFDDGGGIGESTAVEECSFGDSHAGNDADINAAQSASWQIELGDTGTWHYDVETSDQVGEVHITVTYDDGTFFGFDGGEVVVDETITSTPGGGGSRAEGFEDAPPGIYTLTVEAQGLSSVSVVLEGVWDTCA